MGRDLLMERVVSALSAMHGEVTQDLLSWKWWSETVLGLQWTLLFVFTH